MRPWKWSVVISCSAACGLRMRVAFAQAVVLPCWTLNFAVQERS